GLAFPTLSDLPDPISSALSRFPLPRFPFRRFPLYQKFQVGLTGLRFPIIGGLLQYQRIEKQEDVSVALWG
ncbi:hypothetical protein, partial [Streptomyces sp. NPDC007904]|uniref:hypothetical protein n=1 Tax=Streptomyces sp. NPDC007904 TaxID=3364787 RepID=UPI0036E010A3